MRFLTLVEIELKKMLPILFGILTVGILGHLGLFARSVFQMKDSLVAQAQQAMLPIEEFVKVNSPVTLSGMLDESMFPMIVFAFVGGLFLLYVLYMWYKEWFGTSKRIYTLLTIKGSRFNIFASKLVAFGLGLLLFNGAILIALLGDSVLMNQILPEGAAATNLVNNALTQSMILGYIFPQDLMGMLYKFMFGIMMFSALSAFVLMDRSKRIWGMVAGFVYGAVLLALLIWVKTRELYTVEVIMANWTYVLSVLLVSTGISYYLLKKKVSI